ncbi:single-stranded DNA-binding protein [Melissospora conviva]|uniref:single-stranded DNA-binding protein n=1 Tax=Melissospora conviva TaxID=3388432 RepID=UPI003C221844
MFDTNVTVVGNVLTAPQWRRTAQSNALVANFKVASTARRLDRETGRWVDGNSLRVRVNCWRKLAEGVASSVMVGDPVVVVGRLYTRDWTDDEGNHRTVYELEAVAVGHDLARGRARFMRNRPAPTTSTVEDAETENRVHGEATVAVPAAQAPAGEGHAFDAEFDFAAESTAGAGSRYDAGPQPMPGGSDDELSEYPEHETEPGDDGDDDRTGDVDDDDEQTGAAGRGDADGSPFGEHVAPGDGSPFGEQVAPEPEAGPGAGSPKTGTRARRGRPRTPVPA